MRMLHLLLAILVCMAAVSCGAVKQSDDTGMRFYQCLRQCEYDRAMEYLDPEAISHTPMEIWTSSLQKKGDELGPILNIEKNSFESMTSENVTKVVIRYKVHYSKATMYERLDFIERNSQYRITFYQYDEDSTMVN